MPVNVSAINAAQVTGPIGLKRSADESFSAVPTINPAATAPMPVSAPETAGMPCEFRVQRGR